MTDADHFAAVASEYARFRPRYPEALFDFLARAAPRNGVAWDVGTGSGQAACALALHFERVVGTDLSVGQLRAADAHERVTYIQARAEAAPFADHSVDLITAAQAVHWFDLDRFYGEVHRVAVPGAVVAVWSYYLATVNPDVDVVVQRLAHDILGRFWPFERRLVEERYESLEFPFEVLSSPEFEMKMRWTLEDLLGYLGTWSALGPYLKANRDHPLIVVGGDLKRAWGDTASARWVRWPLRLLVGRCN